MDFDKDQKTFLRELAIDEANSFMTKQVEVAKRLLEEVRRYADRIAETEHPEKKAEYLDWFLNHITQRTFDVSGATTVLIKLVQVAGHES